MSAARHLAACIDPEGDVDCVCGLTEHLELEAMREPDPTPDEIAQWDSEAEVDRLADEGAY